MRRFDRVSLRIERVKIDFFRPCVSTAVMFSLASRDMAELAYPLLKAAPAKRTSASPACCRSAGLVNLAISHDFIRRPSLPGVSRALNPQDYLRPRPGKLYNLCRDLLLPHLSFSGLQLLQHAFDIRLCSGHAGDARLVLRHECFRRRFTELSVDIFLG